MSPSTRRLQARTSSSTPPLEHSHPCQCTRWPSCPWRQAIRMLRSQHSLANLHRLFQQAHRIAMHSSIQVQPTQRIQPQRRLPLIADSARAVNPQLQLPHDPRRQRAKNYSVQPSKTHARTHRSKDAFPVALARAHTRSIRCSHLQGTHLMHMLCIPNLAPTAGAGPRGGRRRSCRRRCCCNTRTTPDCTTPASE